MQILPLEQITALVSEKMKATENLMQKEMHSSIPLSNLVVEYALGHGGKRFRPLLTLLSAGLCEHDEEDIITAAAFIEFIHNATLLHDDVVDESTMRRGQPTANIAFSNAASVLVGDFLYTRAFQLMVRIKNHDVIATMSDATNLLAMGEVLQLSYTHNAELNEENYYRVIEMKTAVLFSAACKVAAQLAKHKESESLAEYGRFLGLAFQIQDDVLDYMGDSQTIGKSLGDDLAEGKTTLPLIRALNQLSTKEKQQLEEIIKNGKREAIHEVLLLLNKTDAIAYSQKKAQKMADIACSHLKKFPENTYRHALESLAYHAANRKS